MCLFGLHEYILYNQNHGRNVLSTQKFPNCDSNILETQDANNVGSENIDTKHVVGEK